MGSTIAGLMNVCGEHKYICWYFIDNIPGINHFHELPEIMRKDSRVDE
jgi:hypothetical protein